MGELSSNIQLLQKYKQTKDLNFLSKLYGRYTSLVYGVCLKYLKNRDDAQDAVMDVFEKLKDELIKRDTPDEFRPWLYVVVKNHCLMKLRKDSSEHRNFEKFSSENMESDHILHPLDTDSDDDILKVLADCLEKLKEQHRACVKLFYYEKLCYVQISERINITEKKVKSYLQNGKRNLKICIEKNSGE